MEKSWEEIIEDASERAIYRILKEQNGNTFKIKESKWSLIKRGFYENLVFFILEWMMWILFLWVLGVF